MSSVQTPTTRDAFLSEASALLLDPVGRDGMLKLSTSLKAQCRERLLDADSLCMLPSYNHLLPTGAECGSVVSIDMGGTTLRIGLVELRGRGSGPDAAAPEITVVNRVSWTIKNDVKALKGMAFFLWLAERIVDVVAGKLDSLGHHPPGNEGSPISLALAWSFPIIQTSLTTGLIQPMGKSFHADDGMVGRDLASVIQTACARWGLDVKLRAIMNDSGTTLFSRAYTHPHTRMGLILGTGTNVSCLIPTPCLARAKFGDRAQSWFDAARHVVVNVELGLFGGGIMPFTRWDAALREAHPRPDFQPLEYFTSGQYLGEICRLALVEAIRTTGTLGGIVPELLEKEYSLDSETLSVFKGDDTPTLEKAREHFVDLYPSDPSPEDLQLIRQLSSLIASRSSALVATALFTLWELQLECEEELSASAEHQQSDNAAEHAAALAHAVVAYNGSVMEKFPNYKEQCQKHLDDLVSERGHTGKSIRLVAAEESSLLGAAVAASCLEEELELLE